ncbi:carboxymuconolactone decarboxylase family protein [Pseudonocardia zijingensis]|jgi:4-carboxymuconolactone decarboxylase|uniref:Carboxymuconolactone decarboxylase family protein n=1 Tax=Pseudonocardia zijingensis TaxID=153376 RepID=A0ABN1Q4Z3_9PSEU
MAIQRDALGGRLPLTDPATLTSAQQELVDSVMANQLPWANENGFQIRADDGQLIGPFNTFLLQPEVALRFLGFAAAEASHTSLSDTVREVVIVAVGAVWGADYELYAHKILARRIGLPPEVVTALSEGAVPDQLGEHEKIAVRVARQLLIEHRLDDDLFRVAEQAFGKRGLYDIGAVMGQYQAVCTLLTMFAVPAPE